MKRGIKNAEMKIDPSRNNKKSNKLPLPMPALIASMDDEEVSEITLAHQIITDSHRDKLSTVPLNFMGAVVKLLTRRDVEWYSPEAKAALLIESTKLLNAGVWDLKPVEKDDALRMFPDASFSRLFEILGLKNSEDPKNAKFKARIVVQGSNVKDGWGEAVYFSDTSSAPTNMAAIRSVYAFGELTGSSSSADAEAAYSAVIT